MLCAIMASFSWRFLWHLPLFFKSQVIHQRVTWLDLGHWPTSTGASRPAPTGFRGARPRTTSRGSKRCAMFTSMRAARRSSPTNSIITPGVRGMEKPSFNPMNPVHRLRLAPRCLAKTRRGTACQCPKIKDRKRCRLHGGRAGAPKGNRNAWKHGGRSAETRETLALIRALSSQLDELNFGSR